MIADLGRVDGIARKVADRLADSDSDSDPNSAPSSLGGVDEALGVAFALRHAADVLGSATYDDAARRHLRSAARATTTHPLERPALFGGTAGFAWAVAEFARVEPEYLATLRKVGTGLARQVSAADRSTPIMDSYDVISGAAGQLTALLRVSTSLGGEDTDEIDMAAERLLAYLVEPGEHDTSWFVPPTHYPPFDFYSSALPNGMYNLGFAHGLPGILAAMCAATTHGLGGDSARARVHELATWISDVRLEQADGPAWPWALGADPTDRRPLLDPAQSPARTAWCYGAPGVAVALLTAAAVTGDASMTETAVDALREATRTAPEDARCYAPTLCHGKAGLLAVLTRVTAIVDAPVLEDARDTVLAELCALADDERPYVFADEPTAGNLVDDPGLLTGAAGVLLALLGASSPVAARWDERLFLAPAPRSVPA